MTQDLLRQYQLAFLVDHFPLRERLVRLAGLEHDEIEALVDGVMLVPAAMPDIYGWPWSHS